MADVQGVFAMEFTMNRNVALCTLIGTAVLTLTPALALAQVRGSMIPPETLAVALQRQDRMFDRLDTNKDGAITTDEIQAMAQQFQGQGGPGGQGAPGGAGGPGGGGRGAGMMARMFQTADKDGDGKITRDEMRVSATERFNEQDKNKDGVVSADERPAFPGRPGPGVDGPPQGGMPPMGDMTGGN